MACLSFDVPGSSPGLPQRSRRDSAVSLVATGPQGTVLPTDLIAAGLTCTCRNTRLFHAIAPKRRGALTAGLTAGPSAGPTAAGVTPAETTGHCIAFCFHDKLLSQGLNYTLETLGDQSQDGRGYPPRPFQHSIAGTTPHLHAYVCRELSDRRVACCLRFRRIATNSYTACAVRPY